MGERALGIPRSYYIIELIFESIERKNLSTVHYNDIYFTSKILSRKIIVFYNMNEYNAVIHYFFCYLCIYHTKIVSAVRFATLNYVFRQNDEIK